MSLSPAAWERAKQLFHEALQRPPAERAAFLAGTGEGGALLDEVRALLAAHDEASEPDPADEPDPDPFPPTQPRTPASSEPLLASPGAVIDRYKILQEIGEGGFGTVYMAEQLRPVRRKVAFKILKAGMDTRQVIARFEAEQQALALMDHHNIARVYDAGATVTGRPYFVMELVRGVQFTEYCDTAKLDTRRRIALFLDVCAAIQHAHQKGIIHRDIKPSNVLVTLHDGVPVPKVIDFGIAKATDHRLTEKTLFTEFRQLVGTPEYMAPEQAEMSGLDVDTRADVYSLGVLLYELLSGSKPFELKDSLQNGYDAVLRQIREIDPPPPSTRVSTAGRGGAALAERHGSDPHKLRSALRGDLDHVVMKALAKDRNRRYETVNGLAADLRRYLADEPVSAGPPTLGYRLGKLARRHRTVATVALAVLVSLVLGLGLALWQAEEAHAQAQRANHRSKEASEARALAERREAEVRNLLDRAQLAETEARDALAAEQQARREAVGLRLSAQAIALADEDPDTALRLAIEGAQRAPGDDANNALYTALQRHHLLDTLHGHDAASRKLTVAANGRYAVSADDSQLTIVWDLQERRALHRFEDHDEEITAVGFLEEETLCWSASLDGTLRCRALADGTDRGTWSIGDGIHWARSVETDDAVCLWTRDGRLLVGRPADDAAPQELLRVGKPRRSAEVAGRRIVLLDERSRLHVVDVDRAKLPRVLALDDRDPPDYYNVRLWYEQSVEVDASGRTALVRTRAGDLYLVDLEGPSIRRRIVGPDARPGFTAGQALAPSGRWVFALRRSIPGSDMLAEIVDADTGGSMHRLGTTRDFDIRGPAWFAHDSNLLVTTNGTRLALWDVGSGAQVGTLGNDPHGHHALRFVPGGDHFLTAGHSGGIDLWDPTPFETSRVLAERRRGDGGAELSRVSADGRLAIHQAPRSPDGPDAAPPRLLLDLHSDRALAEIAPDLPEQGEVAFSADGLLLFVSAGDGSGSRVLETASRRVLAEPSPPGEFWDVARFTPDGRNLIARTGQEYVAYDLDQQRELGRVPVTWQLPAALSPDGRQLVRTDGASGTVTVFDLARGAELQRIQHTALTFDAGYTPDGRYLCTVANDSGMRIHDAATFATLAICRVPTADYIELSFAPASDRVAVRCAAEILLFEVPSGRRLARWADPDVDYRSCAFAPDGESLTVLDARGRVVHYPLDPLAYARSRIDEPLTAALMERYDLGTPAERAARAEEQRAELASMRALLADALGLYRGNDLAGALRQLDRGAALRKTRSNQFHVLRAVVLTRLAAEGASEGSARERALADAVAELQTLAARGYRNADSLANSPELAPLRGRPDFEAVLDAMR